MFSSPRYGPLLLLLLLLLKVAGGADTTTTVEEEEKSIFRRLCRYLEERTRMLLAERNVARDV